VVLPFTGGSSPPNGVPQNNVRQFALGLLYWISNSMQQRRSECDLAASGGAPRKSTRRVGHPPEWLADDRIMSLTISPLSM